jgi:diacylglycerol O-acyltransferase
MITNIPGPQMALYQMGAQMLENYPVVPMLEEMGLGIGVMSYNGTMFWGITVDTDIVTDAAPFCAALQRAVKSVARAAKVRLR